MNIVRIDDLMRDPASIFNTPADLAEDPGITRAQKIAALRQWKDEIEQRLIAEAEAMTGNSESAEQLKQVSDALNSLGRE